MKTVPYREAPVISFANRKVSVVTMKRANTKVCHCAGGSDQRILSAAGVLQ